MTISLDVAQLSGELAALRAHPHATGQPRIGTVADSWSRDAGEAVS